MVEDEIKPGHWYLCVRCHSCGMEIPLVENGPIVHDCIDTYSDVECYYCGQKSDYSLADLKSLRARPRQVGSAD